MGHEIKNILVNRIHDGQLRRFAEEHIHGRLIDIGCGVKPYKTMLSSLVHEHVGLDHLESIHGSEDVDLVGSAYSIPECDCSFDSAICTAVLEHIEDPVQALGECYRVLKPGGKAIYSVPFIWHLHEEPRDFYRYTKWGLKHLAESVGFQIVEMRALSGFWVTFGQLFVYNMYRFNRGPLRWFRVIDALGLAIQALSYTLNKIDRTEQWTWMYMVVLQRPVTPTETGIRNSGGSWS